MTNPNNGTPVQMRVPELLEGNAQFAAEIESWDESTSAAQASRTARRLCAELDRSAGYGRALWHQLAEVSTYLREDIAHAGTDAGLLLDEQRRGRWAELYGRTLSLLAGAQGDSGFGEEQARLELQNATISSSGES
jgi:hypothetical protein